MKKFGLIGNKISYSLSPKVHGIIYSELGIDADYSLIEIPQGGIGERIGELKTFDGFNLAQPHKIAIGEFLTENNSPIGAVNTVKNAGGNFYGYNTDVFGFSRDLDKNFGDLSGATVLIVGAGGMAEAAVFVMQEKGAEVYIKNRTEEKAEELCRKSGAMLFKSGLSPDMIVNCSSAELFGGKVDLSGVATQNLKFAYDTVYKNTEFVSTLSAAGVKVASGLNMLIYQAVKAVEIFTDIVLQDDEIERLKDKIRSELIK